VSSSYIFDYAIIIKKADGSLIRLDLTIVPKVYRYGKPATAFLCTPDAEQDSPVTERIVDYIPRTTSNCAVYTPRSPPYAIAASDYASLHPEEAEWLQERLDKTAPQVQQFVAGKLTGGKTLSPPEARLKIAVANTGGGKRAMLHSLGMCPCLNHRDWAAKRLSFQPPNQSSS
jgi:hypothetical protein